MFIKGLRSDATDRRYVIRNTDVTVGADLRLYSTVTERDAALEALNAGATWIGDYYSQYNGGSWVDEPVFDEPEIDAEIAREFPGTREEQATAKLRELIRERNNLRQEQVNRETAHAEALARLREQLQDAHAEITDTNDERLAPIWSMAEEAATEEGFCSEYDRLANRLGIPGRVRLRRAIVKVSFNVYAYAEVRSNEEAEEAMEQAVREAVARVETEDRYSSHSDGSLSHADVDDISVENVEVYE